MLWALLALRWPLRWRWARELQDACKTWLHVSRTWATIVLAVAIPAALARGPEPSPSRPDPQINQFQSTPEPYPKERRPSDEDWTTFSRENYAQRRPVPPSPRSRPEPGPSAGDPRGEPPRGEPREQRDPLPWVPRRYEPEPEREPVKRTTEQGLAALGERLFFETRFSKSGATGCASCHRPERAFSDIGRTSRADDGKAGRRNAPSLINSAGLPIVLWDGSARTLEQQALEPWKRGEMGITIEQAERRLRGDPEYVDLFRELTGQAPSASGMAAALAAFQRTLISPESRLERYLRGDARALSPLEQDGHRLFEGRAGCSGCHTIQPAFYDGAPLQLSDFQFHNTGVGYQGRGKFADEGRYRVTKQRQDLGAFRTPALRNLGRTAPYMHDGSLPTLPDVVEFYSDGGRSNPNQSRLIRPLYLGSHEKEALVAFLRSLDDPVLTADCQQRAVWWTPHGCGRPRKIH